ncbi:MAG: DUF4340 domain-containing protein [Pontiellaceae bacterium]|nr:DUF4340 domain-containing protein [Pontiellaceae bacterium]
MKDRTIQVLLITIVALGVLIGLLEFRSYRALKQRYQQSIVFDLDASKLNALYFSGTDFAVNCEKKNGEWLAGTPELGLGRADEEIVTGMINALNSLRRGMTLSVKQMKSHGRSMSSYGFDSPLMTIEAVGAEGRRKWIVGSKTVDNKEVYIREAGRDKEIFTVSSRLLDYVPLRVEDLRSRTPFPWVPSEVQKVELRRTSGFVQVVKNSDGVWKIKQPMEVIADPGEFGYFVNQLCQLRIESFEAENVADLSAFGLQDEGSRQISLTGSDGTTRTLVVGDAVSGRAGFVYAYRKDNTSVFTMRDDVLALLDKKVNQLRDARVVSIPVEDISGVSYSSNNRMVELAKTETGQWEVLAPAPGVADPLKIRSLLLWWQQIVITDFETEINQDEPSNVIEFYSSSGETNRVEVLPRLVNGSRLVRLNEDSIAHSINLASINTVINSLNPLDYRSTKIFDIPKNGVNKISVKKTGALEQVVLLEEDGTFVAESANGGVQVVRPVVEQVLTMLSKLQTPEYITYNPSSLTPYGLDEPLMEVYIGLSDPEELGRVLLIGDERENGFCAMVKGQDIIFLVGKDVVRILSADLVKAVGTPDSSLD